MKSSTDALNDLLASTDAYRMAELWTITTVGAEVLRYTAGDFKANYGGHAYAMDGPLIKRGEISTGIGLDVDSLDLTITTSDPAHLLNGAPFIRAALMDGALDGASIEVRRVYFSSWSAAAVGALLLFSGRVSSIEGSRHELQVTVASDLELLNVKLPRNVYQPACSLNVYSTPCGANRAAVTVTGTVTSVIDGRVSFDTGLGQVAGWFDLGTLTFTSGANDGQSRTVKSFQAGGAFSFALAWPADIAVGNTFSVYPACMHTMDDCTNKHNNIVHFRGYPFVPAPETIT